MYLIDENKLPTPNRNIFRLVIDNCSGNVAEFARRLGISNSTKINRIFQKDKRSGKYPVPSTEIIMAIRERFGVQVDSLLYSDKELRQNVTEQPKTVNNINIIKGRDNSISTITK